MALLTDPRSLIGSFQVISQDQGMNPGLNPVVDENTDRVSILFATADPDFLTVSPDEEAAADHGWLLTTQESRLHISYQAFGPLASQVWTCFNADVGINRLYSCEVIFRPRFNGRSQ